VIIRYPTAVQFTPLVSGVNAPNLDAHLFMFECLCSRFFPSFFSFAAGIENGSTGHFFIRSNPLGLMDQMQPIANVATAVAKRHSTQKIEVEMGG
jgi:hypothetical protein